LIGFLAYLDEKLCHKNQKVVKIATPKKGNQGGTKPLLYVAITIRRNRLESCSIPLKQWFSNGRHLAHSGRNFQLFGGNLFQGGIGEEKLWMKKL